MSEWELADTNTHQDHVIAHVLGASVLGHFVWDETAFLLLDIGFFWHIYLDGEMGLVPQTQAITELNAEDETKRQLREDIDALTTVFGNSVVQRLEVPGTSSPIERIDYYTSNDGRRFVLACESGTLVLETSLSAAEVQIYEL